MMSCHILDHVADEIGSNKARVTHKLDESTRETSEQQSRGGSKKN